MAVLKIPQSTQQAKAGGNLSGIDTTLPLNLARQQGAAISSVGKVFEDIYKEQRAIEDGASPEELEAMAYEHDKAIMPKIEKFIKNPIDSTVKTVKDTFTKEPKVEETPRELGLPPEEDNEVSLGESVTSAINSGLLKIPKGVINFGTLVYDALQEEGIPVEQGATYKFNKAFEDTYLGIIEKES